MFNVEGGACSAIHLMDDRRYPGHGLGQVLVQEFKQGHRQATLESRRDDRCSDCAALNEPVQ